MATKTYIVKGCDCCGPAPAPCTCPDAFTGATAPSYQISGMSETYFGDVTITGSAFDTLLPPVWDGSFVYGEIDCGWRCGQTSDFPMLKNTADDKYYFVTNRAFEDTQITLNTTDCQWEIEVWAGETSREDLIWTGVKNTGDTPAGTYTRTGGSSSRATVELTEV